MAAAKFKPVDEQFSYLKKGTAEIIRDDELKSKLEKSAATGKPLRVYLGVDPTAPDIHLGHTVVLRKLKHFQDMGHTAIFMIGDFSAWAVAESKCCPFLDFHIDLEQRGMLACLRLTRAPGIKPLIREEFRVPSR